MDDDYVYLTISFPRINVDIAKKIIDAALKEASKSGNKRYTIDVDSPFAEN